MESSLCYCLVLLSCVCVTMMVTLVTLVGIRHTSNKHELDTLPNFTLTIEALKNVHDNTQPNVRMANTNCPVCSKAWHPCVLAHSLARGHGDDICLSVHTRVVTAT